MVDMWLAHQLFTRLRRGTKLLLLGDVDQLESVGAGNVLRDIQDKCCLTHRRAGGDQNQIRRLHTGGAVIQVREAGGDASDRVLIAGRLVDLLQCVQSNLLDRNIVAVLAAV